MSTPPRCPASTSIGNPRQPTSTHTIQCQREAGHAERGEAAHQWTDGGARTVTWYGDAVPVDDWAACRDRYGLRSVH
jgi:hypothetical protein